jgi:hypothetical protein
LKALISVVGFLLVAAILVGIGYPYYALFGDLYSIPSRFQPITTATSDPAFVLELLKIALPSCAFITALYALYSKDARLRASGEQLFFSLLFFVGSTLLFVVALVMSKASLPNSRGVVMTGVVTYTAILLYVAGIAFLLLRVFLPTYNQLYNLKATKAIRNLKPIRWLRRKLWEKPKRYEFQVKPRQPGEFLSALKDGLSARETDRLKNGGAILLTGTPTLRYLDLVAQLVRERLGLKETVNYVCAHRPPGELWHEMQTSVAEEHRKAFVFIDAYSPNFAFTDDIHRETLEQLKGSGVEQVRAKSLAGLHSATNDAFNLIKDLAHEAGRPDERAPMLMIYDHTSVLCDMESVEQFSVFWRHVIPSERAYKMLTLIVEDDATPNNRTDVLRQLVDVVLEVSLETRDDGDFVVVAKQ